MPRIVHFEIQAENPERAIQFYGSLFGWVFTKWEGPMPYWLIKTGESSQPGIDGGLLPRRGALDGEAVIAYVCTADVPNLDDYFAKALSLGGQSGGSENAHPGVGWLAYCKDTEGNIFGMMQADPQAA